ncbi:AAA family ATPase [Hymenobacter coalescens]
MEEIKSQSPGAIFVRADLHIHSFGDEGSFDVTDPDMTPENIVDTAIANGLKLIAITDHNEIGNVKRAIKYAEGKPILVIPGIEVSTTQGHLLVYFNDFDNLKKFYGKLTISKNRETCSEGIVNCLDIAYQFEGIGILAHIELTSGFEKSIGRFGPAFEEVFTHNNLWGLEISSKSSYKFYTDEDESADRKRMINLRRAKLGLAADFELAKLMSSDSHVLSKLGTNANGEKKLTRFKIDHLNFQAFKVALISHNSRVRLEELIPERTPKFIGIKIQGGLLDNQVVQFSSNLTCIIGGRGAGKSTFLESLRESSGNASTSRVVDSDVWPETISLYYEDETGRVLNFVREKNGKTINYTDPVNGITKIPIESYGQGQTADTIQNSDQDPSVLIDFLDSFIDVEVLKTEEDETRALLIENKLIINKLRIEVSGIEETEREKINLEKKLEQLKTDKIGELVELQTALITEREIRNTIVNELKQLIDKYKKILSDKDVFLRFDALEYKNIIVGKDHFLHVKNTVKEFADAVELKSNELNYILTEKINDLRTQLTNWASKEAEIQTRIDTKKHELDQKGIPFDLGKINQMAKDANHYSSRLNKLLQQKKELGNLLNRRTELATKLRDVRNKIYYTRSAFASLINDNLKNSVDGLHVSVKYEKGLYSPEFEDKIKSTMEWRTVQVSKAKIISNNFPVDEFIRSVRKKTKEPFQNIKNEDGARTFTDQDIDKIFLKLNQSYCYEDFESLKYDDKPSITITKIVHDTNGKPKPHSKPISSLSLGQQQSILLAILLQSKSKVPLLIDQPEDNLDSEFIYKTIVTNLRRIKEKRQVIIVTHNSNIAVLGDAELIAPLKSTSLKSLVMDRGSIDNPQTRDHCCDILEGGKSAFNRRKQIYGID